MTVFAGLGMCHQADLLYREQIWLSIVAFAPVHYAQMSSFVSYSIRTLVLCRQGLKEGRLRVMASGNDLPVIDLRRVDPYLCAALLENQVRHRGAAGDAGLCEMTA